MDFPRPIASSHEGYPLIQAVHAEFIPLMLFLLDHGADAAEQEYSALRVAIGKKDLKLTKILLEFGEMNPKEGWTAALDHLLYVAIEFDAQDIVKYFIEDHRCVLPIEVLCMLN